MYLLMVFVAASNIQAAYDNKLVATVLTEKEKQWEKELLTKAAHYCGSHSKKM